LRTARQQKRTANHSGSNHHGCEGWMQVLYLRGHHIVH
jgi:hypothetical protein